ncbi:MAG: hypothetical protein LUI39_02985, partial [Lachnospiraceae bacterium]|nr:hypothetical protein [Lachnospiraceae bacterium]
MKKFVRQMGCLFCLLLCGLFYTSAAATEEAVNPETTGTLTVSYTFGTDAEAGNNLALPGVCFRLYRIASISANGTYSLTDEFADSGLTNEQLNSLEKAHDVTAVVNTLVSWLNDDSSETDSGTKTETEAESLQTENADPETEDADYQTDTESIKYLVTQTAIAAAKEARTDENGTAVFTELQTGLYLLAGESLTIGEKIYTNSATLVSIPSLKADETGWNYDVTVNAKAEENIVEPETEEPTEQPTEPPTEEPTEEQTELPTETHTDHQKEAQKHDQRGIIKKYDAAEGGDGG